MYKIWLRLFIESIFRLIKENRPKEVWFYTNTFLFEFIHQKCKNFSYSLTIGLEGGNPHGKAFGVLRPDTTKSFPRVMRSKFIWKYLLLSLSCHGISSKCLVHQYVFSPQTILMGGYYRATAIWGLSGDQGSIKSLIVTGHPGNVVMALGVISWFLSRGGGTG